MLLIGLFMLATLEPGAQSDTHDVQAIIRATLVSSEQIHHRESRRPCVAERIEGVALQRMRSDMQQMADHDPRERDLQERVRRGELTPSLGWTRPSVAPGAWSTRTPLAANDARPLDAAIFDLLLAAEAPPQLATMVSSALLPASFRLCQGTAEPRGLVLSSPVIRADVAFIEADYDGGGLQFGLLYALRRTAGGWNIVSIRGTRIS